MLLCVASGSMCFSCTLSKSTITCPKLPVYLIDCFVKLLLRGCYGLATCQLFRQRLPGVAGPEGPRRSGLIVVAREHEAAFLPAVEFPITPTHLPAKEKWRHVLICHVE